MAWWQIFLCCIKTVKDNGADSRQKISIAEGKVRSIRRSKSFEDLSELTGGDAEIVFDVSQLSPQLNLSSPSSPSFQTSALVMQALGVTRQQSPRAELDSPTLSISSGSPLASPAMIISSPPSVESPRLVVLGTAAVALPITPVSPPPPIDTSLDYTGINSSPCNNSTRALTFIQINDSVSINRKVVPAAVPAPAQRW